ncbi:MAG: hypothetical protein ACI8TP_003558 [Acidimicrobiales bacterium]|jgi:hypothetical protein
MTSVLPLLLQRLAPGIWSAISLPADTALQLGGVYSSLLDLDLSGVSEKEGVLERLAAAGNFPDHFDRNWDAAYDCLTDLDVSLLLVRGTGALPPDVYRTLLSITTDAVDYWQRQGRRPYLVWESLADYPVIPLPNVRGHTVY